MSDDSSENVSLKMKNTYVAFEYWSFSILGLLLKRNVLVLSSPKWMLSLLFTNQSHIKLKFLLSWTTVS